MTDQISHIYFGLPKEAGLLCLAQSVHTHLLSGYAKFASLEKQVVTLFSTAEVFFLANWISWQYHKTLFQLFTNKLERLLMAIIYIQV